MISDMQLLGLVEEEASISVMEFMQNCTSATSNLNFRTINSEQVMAALL